MSGGGSREDEIGTNLFAPLFQLSKRYAPPIRAIGHGAHGIICAAVDSETSERVAIKKVSNAFGDLGVAERALYQIKLLSHMDHENVVTLKDIVCPQREDSKDVYIVYELMDADLHQILRSDQPLADEHCQYFIYQLLRGLKYIHSANVIHRRLKPSLLLLNVNDDFKIGGFGLARATDETEFTALNDYDSARYYQAPELLLHCTNYTAAVDIWSVGCILGELLTRNPLFCGTDLNHQLKFITELVGSPDDASLHFLENDDANRSVRNLLALPHHPKQDLFAKFPNAPPLAVDLLEKMLAFDPNRRITANEALSHPYLAALHDAEDEPVCVQPFCFGFEQGSLTLEDLKQLIWKESVKFNQNP